VINNTTHQRNRRSAETRQQANKKPSTLQGWAVGVQFLYNRLGSTVVTARGPAEGLGPCAVTAEDLKDAVCFLQQADVVTAISKVLGAHVLVPYYTMQLQNTVTLEN
jgi:hypothetical protein